MAQVPEHFFHQSAVLPFRQDRGKLEILLVSTRRKKRWVIPKGVRELDMDAASSAAKEALEEAGIEGQLSTEAIGTYKYDKWGGTCTVEVYSMAVHTSHDDWPESYRDRYWFTPQEAIDKVNELDLKKIIREFESSQSDA
jgi:8-oxo-dGTP pyrophosphatase MutT (NUDIX family)